MRFLFSTAAFIFLSGIAGSENAAAANENGADNGSPVIIAVGNHASGPVEVPPPSENALTYYHTGNALWLFNTAWGILVPGVLLFTGLSAWIWRWAQRAGRKWFFSVGLYFLVLWVLMYFIDW